MSKNFSPDNMPKVGSTVKFSQTYWERGADFNRSKQRVVTATVMLRDRGQVLVDFIQDGSRHSTLLSPRELWTDDE